MNLLVGTTSVGLAYPIFFSARVLEEKPPEYYYRIQFNPHTNKILFVPMNLHSCF